MLVCKFNFYEVFSINIITSQIFYCLYCFRCLQSQNSEAHLNLCKSEDHQNIEIFIEAKQITFFLKLQISFHTLVAKKIANSGSQANRKISLRFALRIQILDLNYVRNLEVPKCLFPCLCYC